MKAAHRVNVVLFVVLLATALGPDLAAGQGWTVEAAAGGVDHEAFSGDVGTRSLMLGVQYGRGTRWLSLSAGAPLTSAALPWGAAGLGDRLVLGDLYGGALAMGADLSLQAYGYDDRVLDALGGGATVSALPFLALSRGVARLEAYTGLLHHTGFFDSGTASRTVVDAGVRLELTPGTNFSLAGEGRYVRAEEGEYPYAGVSAELSGTWGALWGYAGAWMSDAISESAWGAGVSVQLMERLALNASAEQLAPDPLYWNAPRRTWMVGLSHALGRPAARPAPLPVVPPDPSGGVTFEIPLGAAERAPSVAGDFNEWTPVPMVRSGDAWTITLPVGSGVYRYAFQAADGSWFVPESVPGRVDDGFGGVSAVLIVP